MCDTSWVCLPTSKYLLKARCVFEGPAWYTKHQPARHGRHWILCRFDVAPNNGIIRIQNKTSAEQARRIAARVIFLQCVATLRFSTYRVAQPHNATEKYVHDVQKSHCNCRRVKARLSLLAGPPERSSDSWWPVGLSNGRHWAAFDRVKFTKCKTQ